ncbi:MAG TPA: hypothetical protein PKE39_13835 [Ignavibacteria bacterium]|nr:hypothetical protein [Ignavibacteria bacterium]HMR00099.1 hypothetical protein [Ignavibacteria bacterium]
MFSKYSASQTPVWEAKTKGRLINLPFSFSTMLKESRVSFAPKLIRLTLLPKLQFGKRKTLKLYPKLVRHGGLGYRFKTGSPWLII